MNISGLCYLLTRNILTYHLLWNTALLRCCNFGLSFDLLYVYLPFIQYKEIYIAMTSWSSRLGSICFDSDDSFLVIDTNTSNLGYLCQIITRILKYIVHYQVVDYTPCIVIGFKSPHCLIVRLFQKTMIRGSSQHTSCWWSILQFRNTRY